MKLLGVLLLVLSNTLVDHALLGRGGETPAARMEDNHTAIRRQDAYKLYVGTCNVHEDTDALAAPALSSGQD